MNKLHASFLFIVMMGMQSFAFAGWKDDCKKIEQEGPAKGLCDAIQSQVTTFEAYAPIKPFHDLTINGNGLDGKFPWGTPVWATGSGGGNTEVLSTDGSSQETSSSNGDSSGTFQ